MELATLALLQHLWTKTAGAAGDYKVVAVYIPLQDLSVDSPEVERAHSLEAVEEDNLGDIAAAAADNKVVLVDKSDPVGKLAAGMVVGAQVLCEAAQTGLHQAEDGVVQFGLSNLVAVLTKAQYVAPGVARASALRQGAGQLTLVHHPRM